MNHSFFKTFTGVLGLTVVFFLTSIALGKVANDGPFPDTILGKLEKHMNRDLVDLHLTMMREGKEFQNLDVKVASYDTKFVDSDDGNLHVELNGYGSKETHLVNHIENGTLTIEVEGSSSMHWSFNSKSAGLTKENILLIALPKEFHGALQFKAGSGDLFTDHLNASEATLATGSGDIVLKGVEIQKLDIKTGSGDQSLAGKIGQLTAQAGSGNIQVKELVGKSAELTAGSGDINVKLDAPEHWTAKVRTGSGDIDSKLEGSKSGSHRFEGGKGPNQLRIQTGSGDVSITL